MYKWEHIGIQTLSSLLKENHHKVSLIDVSTKRIKGHLLTIEELSPDIVAYSTMTTEAGFFKNFNRALKQNSKCTLKSIFGGPHPTFFPEMVEDEDVDAICRGEGEIALVQYIEYLNGLRAPEDVSNFWIRKNGRIIKNTIGPRIIDLDEIPVPDRAIWDVVDSLPAQKAFFASRGCPYDCSYCFNHAYNSLYKNEKPIVRRRSVDHLIKEMEQVLTDYPDCLPFFDDDSFLSISHSWIKEFSKKYVEKIGRPFGCNIRPNEASEEKIQLLAKAGCFYCHFGLESGDEMIANQLLNRHLKNDKILATANLLRKYGIRFVVNIMNGLPTRKPVETDLRTIELAIRCRPDYTMAHMYYPLPKTRLAHYTRQIGLFDEDFNRIGNPFGQYTPLNFTKQTKKELARLNRLFPIVVSFPWMKCVLPVLLKLPFLKLYTFFNYLFTGYCIHLKLRPNKPSISGLLSLFQIFSKKWKASCSDI